MKPTHALFVGGIGRAASLEDIELEFQKFGKCICSFKGNCGFIDFYDHKEAKDAILHVHGMKFAGDRLTVDWQKEKAAVMDVWVPERRRASASVASADRRTAKGESRERQNDRDRENNRRYRGRHRDRRDGRSRDGSAGRDRERLHHHDRDREKYREDASREGTPRRKRGGSENSRRSPEDRSRDRSARRRSRRHSRSRDREVRMSSRNSRDNRDRGDSRVHRGEEADEALPSRGHRTGAGLSTAARSGSSRHDDGREKRDDASEEDKSRNRARQRGDSAPRRDEVVRDMKGAGNGEHGDRASFRRRSGEDDKRSRGTNEKEGSPRDGGRHDSRRSAGGWAGGRITHVSDMESQRKKEIEMLMEMMEEEKERDREEEEEEDKKRRERKGDRCAVSPRTRSLSRERRSDGSVRTPTGRNGRRRSWNRHVSPDGFRSSHSSRSRSLNRNRSRERSLSRRDIDSSGGTERSRGQSRDDRPVDRRTCNSNRQDRCWESGRKDGGQVEGPESLNSECNQSNGDREVQRSQNGQKDARLEFKNPNGSVGGGKPSRTNDIDKQRERRRPEKNERAGRVGKEAKRAMDTGKLQRAQKGDGKHEYLEKADARSHDSKLGEKRKSLTNRGVRASSANKAVSNAQDEGSTGSNGCAEEPDRFSDRAGKRSRDTQGTDEKERQQIERSISRRRPGSVGKCNQRRQDLDDANHSKADRRNAVQKNRDPVGRERSRDRRDRRRSSGNGKGRYDDSGNSEGVLCFDGRNRTKRQDEDRSDSDEDGADGDDILAALGEDAVLRAEEMTDDKQGDVVVCDGPAGKLGAGNEEGSSLGFDEEVDFEDDEEEGVEPTFSLKDIEGMTLSKLREELKRRNLNFSGKRPALSQRLAGSVGLL